MSLDLEISRILVKVKEVRERIRTSGGTLTVQQAVSELASEQSLADYLSYRECIVLNTASHSSKTSLEATWNVLDAEISGLEIRLDFLPCDADVDFLERAAKEATKSLRAQQLLIEDRLGFERFCLDVVNARRKRAVSAPQNS